MCIAMTRLILSLALTTCLCGQDTEFEKVPPEIFLSAVAAVKELGEEVVRGRYDIAIDRMYPQWKARAAKRIGGMPELKEQLDRVSKEMLRRGISITGFKPEGKPKAFEVFPGKKVEVIDGKSVETQLHTKWLVLVPTVTTLRAMIDGDPVAVNIESTGFQVAVCEKGEDEWFFIDGASVTVSELRSLFITLPKDLKLPPLEKKQIR